ncbi:hypothetical protein GCM10010520_53980 [Rhizobium viscosum]|uniref:Uncharacterized protein n=1 Tax=Rhizobium viscosum TaxID=1673 RepID=A0ABR9J030_RHIVS|nr:hypothetical protein [Rhizobium viscosum]MBE1508803.1 hypothetical protein [Rhizobium viscosum]
MANQETSYDVIVRVEIVNQARAIVTARVYELEDADPSVAEALRRWRSLVRQIAETVAQKSASKAVCREKVSIQHPKCSKRRTM